MAEIYHKINLDVAKSNNHVKIYAKQNDTGTRFIKATILKNGVPFKLTDALLIFIDVKRPDGLSARFGGVGEYTDGIITIEIPEWSLTVPGIVKCDISIIGEGETLTIPMFRMEVEEALYTTSE